MRNDNVILEKSLDFAIRIVNASRHIQNTSAEYILSKQLCKSGTSIGANVREAVMGISPADFLAKMYIALKESYETEYWLTLLFRTDYISKTEYDSLYKDCRELTKLLSSITKTTKEKIIK